MKRLTLNYGARYEHFNASIPAESSPASTWIAARNFPEIKNVPNWNDWAVRLAVAYDLFGDGKTAFKANAGKYVAAQAAGFAQTFNGMSGTLAVCRRRAPGTTPTATRRSSTPTARFRRTK